MKNKPFIVVKSKTYGEHHRAKRGSINGCELNEEMKKSCSDLVLANRYAKLLIGPINDFRHDFKGGLFWQGLVGYLKKQINSKAKISLKGLLHKNIKKEYAMSRLRDGFYASPFLNENNCGIKITTRDFPNFRRQYITGFRFCVLAVYVNFTEMTCEANCAFSPIISKGHAPQFFDFTFDIPKDTQHVLLLLKVDGCEGKWVVNSPSVKAIEIVGVKDF